MTTKIAPPEISENIWGDEPQQAYYEVKYYNPSGFGVERTWVNVLATGEQEAKWFAQSNYGIAQGNMYRVYAFKQNARV